VHATGAGKLAMARCRPAWAARLRHEALGLQAAMPVAARASDIEGDSAGGELAQGDGSRGHGRPCSACGISISFQDYLKFVGPASSTDAYALSSAIPLRIAMRTGPASAKIGRPAPASRPATHVTMVPALF
jgi:hypothetical protein